MHDLYSMYSIATCDQWLPHWTVEIQNISLTVENSIGQCSPGVITTGGIGEKPLRAKNHITNFFEILRSLSTELGIYMCIQ